jgi:two-component system, NarL family, sensor histidine kinase LiaS
MTISDNGSGFDYDSQKKKSYGLSNMKHRITEIGGLFVIDSSSDSGTKVTIKMPFL